MTKVICGSLDCKYHGDDNICMKEEINLSNHLMHTVWEGVQNLWRCRCFEESDEAKRIEEIWKEFFKKYELPAT